jgi:pimeloyl-ACP methyl ester carboxylesterase
LLTADDRTRLGEIGAPTLILWGEPDAHLPLEEQERRAAALPDAILKVSPVRATLSPWSDRNG